MRECKDSRLKKLLKELEEVAADIFPRTRMLRWRYWRIPKHWSKTRYMFGWTTQRDHKGKFYALKYRMLKDDTLKLKKHIAFGRRKIAKARSKKWRDKYYKDSA